MNVPNGSVPHNHNTLQLLHYFRDKSLEELQNLAATCIPAHLVLPTAYLAPFSDKSRTTALIAILLVYCITQGRIIPRQYQLQGTDAVSRGLDPLVDSGTGSGKTLCQTLPNLLFPETTSMTVSPLKRLQILQAAEFERWGIRTVCINEDTPKDTDLWTKIKSGYYQHLIVQPEQLKTFKGHLPKLAALLNVPSFAKTIARVHIDEVHNHWTAGISSYGLPPFRPAWGALNELRLRLPKGTPIQALSGTLPPHIKAAVVDHLNFDPSSYVSLKLSSNRPNTIYATHKIVGSLKDFRNLDFLVPIPYKPLLKIIVFHDDTQQCADAATYLTKRLPLELQQSGLIRHYHGECQKNILRSVDGACQMLHATEGASTGLDVSDIAAVIDYGVPQKKLTGLQRGGRCGRNGALSVYLVMAEPWAYTVSLEAVATDNGDPDRPISGRLVKNSTKPARTGLAMIVYVRTEHCLREKIRDYLADVSVEALKVLFGFCCDRLHPENPQARFDKRTFFHGRFIYMDSTGAIYAGDTDEADRVHLNPPRGKKRKAPGPANRKVVYRGPLQILLHEWLRSAHAADHLRSVRPSSFILDAKAIKVSSMHPDRMKTITQLLVALDETEEWGREWGEKILGVVADYDRKLGVKIGGMPKTKTKTKAATGGGTQQDQPLRKKTKTAAVPAGVLADLSSNLRRSTRVKK
ncbi:P-loop containing nucleoside triphosphate hydrolase protein [Mycena latifolia]|nr:P-loop containing nucleoside triphosphate hydrolase protein [Mycena latifolia]